MKTLNFTIFLIPSVWLFIIVGFIFFGFFKFGHLPIYGMEYDLKGNEMDPSYLNLHNILEAFFAMLSPFCLVYNFGFLANSFFNSEIKNNVPFLLIFCGNLIICILLKTVYLKSFLWVMD